MEYLVSLASEGAVRWRLGGNFLKKATSGKPVRQRDAEATRARILEAAKREFAALGLGGARVDSIATRARANKRMIYHYFSRKEDLFTAVLEEAYIGIREAERKLALDTLEPEAAMDTLVRFTWKYYLDNPEFLTFVNSENLHKARHLKSSKVIDKEYSRFIGVVQDIIDRGVAKGVFRSGLDAVQLNITIAAISYYYLTNKYTGSIIYDRDLMALERLNERVEFNVETIRRLVRTDPAGTERSRTVSSQSTRTRRTAEIAREKTSAT
jgi:AcrR family transcriptional regulator